MLLDIAIGLGLTGAIVLVTYELKHKKSPLQQKVETTMSQAFKDAFAEFQAAAEAAKQKAVADALAGVQPDQGALDAAHAAGVQAESDEDTQLVRDATTAVQGG